MLVRCTPALRKGLTAALLSLSLVWPAAGQGADDLFTVRDVTVDVTAASALAARDQGMREGQRKAFDALFDRLTPEGTRARLPSLDSTAVDAMVQSFQVQEERASDVRYLGRLAVSFNAAAVRRFMRSYNIPYTEVRSRPVLVIPVDQTGGAPVLWQAETAWRQAWADLPLQSGLVPIAIPYGEAQDVADIGVEQAVAGEADPLARIASRYEAGDVAVAILAPAGSGVTVTVTLYPATGSAPESFTINQEQITTSTDAASGSTGAHGGPTGAHGGPTLKAAVEKIVHQLEERWTAANMVVPGQESDLTLSIPFTSQRDWLDTRKRLSAIPTVSQVRLLSLGRDRAEVELRYVGDMERLRSALAQQDLSLIQASEKTELRRRGAVSTPSTPPTP